MAFGRLGSLGAGFAHLGALPGGGVAAPAGGAALLVAEANGFAADFTYATDAGRVAVKTSGTVVSSGTSFFTSSGTSSKWIYNVAGTLVNIPVGTLPLDYDPVTHAARGLLCEPAATNLLVQSSGFDTGWTNSGGASTAGNVTTAPDGTTTADKIIESAGNTFFAKVQSQTAMTGILSVYAKTAGRHIMLYDGNSSKGYGFNLSTGATFAAAGITTTPATIQDVGNGWYRCSIVVTSCGSFNFYLHDGTSHVYQGDGTSGVYLWGAQVETGTVATSYIPTTAASVTRAVDSYNCTAASIGNSGTAGSWWAEMYHNAVLAGTPRIIGTAGAASPLYYTAATTPGMLDTTGLTKTTTTIVGSTHKVACAFASGDRAFTADGLAAATDAGATSGLLAPVTIYLGNGSSTPMNGYLRKLRYLPRRPTNAEIATMTA